MKKSEQYRLWFSKSQASDGRVRYSCYPAIRTTTSDESYYLAGLLDLLSDSEPKYLLEEIENALNNKYFEEYYSLDHSGPDDSIQILPPNVILNNSFSISLIELKLLLEEWILFCTPQ